MNRSRIAVLGLIAAVVATATVVIVLRTSHWRPTSVTIQGAVIRSDKDPRNELPIAGAVVTASDGASTSTTQSDSTGYFKLEFREGVWPGETVNLNIQHLDYRPLDRKIQLGHHSDSRDLNIVALVPIVPQTTQGQRFSVVSNIRVRYTINTQTQTNIGTAVKTFQVANRGNVPCRNQTPCSPDGLWKASMGSVTMDAGPNSEFRNARASCFAGPCPFTRIDSSGYSQGGRVITASALNWSDTATFLLEAEVFRDSTNSSVRESYPVIYGRVLHFTVPATQEGVSIEAEIDGSPMVFPLGPELYMSWATCSSRIGAEIESSATYQCELKPGYRF